MQPHEILRAAADIVLAGWSQGADARDATELAVPLYTGDARATVNPHASRFSGYGAICKAMSQSKRTVLSQTMWSKLRDLSWPPPMKVFQVEAH
jgi:hypothetical protein